MWHTDSKCLKLTAEENQEFHSHYFKTSLSFLNSKREKGMQQVLSKSGIAAFDFFFFTSHISMYIYVCIEYTNSKFKK